MKTKYTWIENGNAAMPVGWLAGGVAAGLKAGRRAVAEPLSNRPAASAALFTSNNAAAAPVG